MATPVQLSVAAHLFQNINISEHTVSHVELILEQYCRAMPYRFPSPACGIMDTMSSDDSLVLWAVNTIHNSRQATTENYPIPSESFGKDSIL